MRALQIPEGKTCPQCGVALLMRPGESPSQLVYRKYCGYECSRKSKIKKLPEKHCQHCQKQFFNRPSESPAYFSERRFCSNECKGIAMVPTVVANNKKRRKYPELPNLSRASIYYRFNPNHQRYSKERGIKQRHELLKILGGKCVKCGYDSDLRALVLDHINGDGKEDRIRVGCKIARYYLKHVGEAKERLQCLCANCNQIKSLENREHNKTRRIEPKYQMI